MRKWIWLGLMLGWAQDTMGIDPRRRLSAYDLERKREKWVFLSYPTAGYDPLRGVGAALVLSISYNGKRSDPTFAYTPYKYYLFIQGGGFFRDSRYLRVFYDTPWIGNRPYRLTLRFTYRDESQGQFWGVGERYFMERLPVYPLSSYEKFLKSPRLSQAGTWETSLAQHSFYISQWQGWIIGERIAERGLVRLMGGARWTAEKLLSLSARQYTLLTPDGRKVSAQQTPTLIDSAAQRLIPLPSNLSILLGRREQRVFLGGAIVLDTRDFEVSPTKGWLIELNHESCIPSLSAHRTTLNLRSYHIYYRSPSEKFLLSGALNVLMTAMYGRALPLTELQVYPRWADGRLPNLLSGPSTVRAFRENRFLSPTAYILQYELRSRVAEARILQQHFVGGPVAFLDIGAGRDKIRPPSLRYLASGVGIGVRILWNMTMVLRADAAYGREGWQLHFTTVHPF
ncbi:MAG: DUF5982 domain-containing protein [Bacteroidia bacterium]|nr:DUF5982 domain-containing protein [Bacteroidia bacterium]